MDKKTRHPVKPIKSEKLLHEFDFKTILILQDEEGGERSPGSEDIKELGIGADECEIIPNDKSTEFILSTVVEEAA